MAQPILFLQGAGEGAYNEDAALVSRLGEALGDAYKVHYPQMPDEADPDYDPWKLHIEQELAGLHEPPIIVGHSLGGSIILKCLSEIKLATPPAGVFLMAAPFWGGDGWRYEGYEALMLPEGFADRTSQSLPFYFYHCRDDDVVPFEHVALYGRMMPKATIRALDTGGHQFSDSLTVIVDDVRNIQI